MTTDPLTIAADAIRQLVTRKVKPLPWLEATFRTVEGMSEDDAKATFAALLQRKYLDVYTADMAQMLAQRLNVEVSWRHARLGDGECEEGRGLENEPA